MYSERSLSALKSTFSTCITMAKQGAPVVITRRGVPVAVLIGIAEFEWLQGAAGDRPEAGLARTLGTVDDEEFARAVDRIVAGRSLPRTVVL